VNHPPDFIDNRDGNTLALALATVLGGHVDGDAAESGDPPDTVRIATAFFNPTGFAWIADHLQPVPTVRLLLGADPAFGTGGERKRLDETPEAFERRRIRVGLRRMDDALHRERDRLPFNRTSARALGKLIEVLRAGNMEVRRYEKAFLHAKAYIVTAPGRAFGKPEGIIVGSSNLTGAGLTRNLELNLGRHDRPVVEQARRWFDDLWDDAAPYDLAVVYKKSKNPYFERRYRAALEQIRGLVLEKGPTGTRKLVRHIRGGGCAAMLIDQHQTGGLDVTFLGKPARTADSAAVLAARYDALFMPVYAVRMPNGLDFEICIEEPIRERTPRATIQAFNDSLEAMVRKHPEQWFWAHRRWRNG